MGTRQPRSVRRAADRDARSAHGTCAAWTSSRTCCPRDRHSPGWRPWPGSARWTPTASSRRSAGTARARSWCSPTGNRPGGSAGSGYTPMTPGELQQVIGALDVAPLGAAPERGFRPSLAGFQRKALLGRAADGTWQLPSGDAPSTWILKPDGPHPMAANEATCLRLAAACGLDAARDANCSTSPGCPCCAVRRYDRRDAPAGGHSGPGAPGGRLPGDRHASRAEVRGTGRPGTARPRRRAAELRRPRDVTSLLRRTTFNMAVGNADAHAKNFSVLHDPDSPADQARAAL